MKTETITLSKTKTLIHCCIVSVLIAATISVFGNISIHEFIQNILDWDSI
jgi:hypothetical protein